LALRAPIDPLRAPVVARRVDRLRLTGEQLDALGLDDQVDHERAPRLALAVEAVAAVRDQRLGGEAVANRSAGATAFPGVSHLGILPSASCLDAGV